MKKILLVFLLGLITLKAQEDDKKPPVQLPQFVITGVEEITIEEADKIKPFFVTTLSKEFIMPQQVIEELELKDMPALTDARLKSFDSVGMIAGRLDAGLGLYNLPSFKMNYNYLVQDFSIDGNVDMYNNRAYETNTEKYGIAVSGLFSYYTPEEADFLPGTVYKGFAGLNYKSYKLFGSLTPELKRNIISEDLRGSLKNISGDLFYNFEVKEKGYTLSDENYSEHLFTFTHNSKLELTNFNAGIDAEYKMQFLTTDSLESMNNSFFKARPYMGIMMFKSFKAVFGANFFYTTEKNYFSPYVMASIFLAQGLTFSVEYNPSAEYYTSGSLFEANPYLDLSKVTTVFNKMNTNLEFRFKFEKKDLIETNAWFRYTNNENLPYYKMNSRGRFDVLSMESKQYGIGGEIMLNLNKAGRIYAAVKLLDTRDTSNMFVPYYPRGNYFLSYNIEIDGGYYIEPAMEYRSYSYYDELNNEQNNGYSNLKLTFGYKLNNDLSFYITGANLLDNKNYIYKGYKETPLNVTAGITYKW